MYICKEYDDALERILNYGSKKDNRTGVGTLSLFGMQTRYDISTNFPLLTGRKLSFKSIMAELVWFISGSTNLNTLERLGCKYWSPWRSKFFEEEKGYVAGALGPVYGFQLRNFGGYYGIGDESTYIRKGGGTDQLDKMIHLLRVAPDSRRNLFSLWHPEQIDCMRLPPCAYTFQLYVNDGKLSGLVNQRSADYPVGVPANIAFYAAIIYLLAETSGLLPGELIHSTADSHIYLNQIDSVEEYLQRDKPDSPQLELEGLESVYDYAPENFHLYNYNPKPAIKFPVAV